MGAIVGAFATSHVVMDPKGAQTQAAQVIDGFKRIAAAVARAQPDLLLYITSDHMVNLGYRLQPTFALGCADSYTPLGDMDIPRLPMAGAGQFADALLRHLDTAGFDLARAESLDPDHGIALPLRIINPGGRIPVAPLLININRDPPPSPARCYALGLAIGEYIRSAACKRRVAVIGAGGLSHWIAIPGMGRVNEVFDRQVIDLLVTGRGSEIATWSAQHLLQQAGNGGLEIMCWLAMAGTVAGSSGQALYYEPIPSWFTGMGAVAMDVAAA
jgi:aromatic ring-opening dioxygenase catalytic subunit (LigB family)